MRRSLQKYFVYLFIFFSFTIVSYRNFIDCYDHPLGKNIASVQKIRKYMNNVLHIKAVSYMFGLGTTWRMYSPTWKYFPWFEWYAKNSSGEWVRIPTRNLSPDFVADRHWFSQPFFDNKLGMLQTSLTQTERYRSDMAEYMCRDVQKNSGWAPMAMRLEEKRRYIPYPGKAINWSPMTKEADYTKDWEFICT